MITLRAIALLVHLLLGDRYPIEVRDIETGASNALPVQTAPQVAFITAKGYTVTQIERPVEITRITKHASQITQVIETTSIEELTTQFTQVIGTTSTEELITQSTQSSKITTTTNSESQAKQSTEITAAKDLQIQENPEWISSEVLSPVCNFDLFRLTSRLLEPPYDIAGAANLIAEWESIANQLSEIRRLLSYHWDSLVKLHGYQEVVLLQDSLVAWVETPLKFGCSTLQHVHDTLLSLVHVSKERRGLRKALLKTALQEYETEIQSHITNESPELPLPAWAQQASELRSDNCPDGNCFMRGTSPIYLVAAEIPYGLLRTVQNLQIILSPGLWQTIKLIFKRTWENLVWWYWQFSLLWTKELLTTAFLVVFLATGYRMWFGGLYHLELRKLGVDDEPRKMAVLDQT